MTQDKLQQHIEWWANNAWLQILARGVMLIGVPACLGLLGWIVTEIIHIGTHELLVEQQAANDRKWMQDHEIEMQKRVDIVSGHVTDLKNEVQHDFARKAEVELGFRERDQRLNELERRFDGRTSR